MAQYYRFKKMKISIGSFILSKIDEKTQNQARYKGGITKKK